MIKRLISLRPLHRQEPGIVLVTVIITISVLLVVGLSLVSTTTSQYALTGNDTYQNNSLLTAEAGIEQSLQQLNQSDSFSGYSTGQQFFNSATQGIGSFTTTVTASGGDPNAKIITSTAKVYRYHNTTTPVSTRIVRVTVVGTSAPGYSVYSGPGGLILGGVAAITNSQVYVNGTLSLAGTSRIGTSSLPLSVNVANQACPAGATPGPTYPQVCSGTQPITTAFSTSIYGTVCATGQTSVGPNHNIQGGNGGSGLQIGCTAPPVAMPTYDKAAQVSAVTTSAAATDNTYVCASFPFNRTWPANLKLVGNVSIAGTCNVVIKGNVYITGDLDIGGTAKFTVDNSVGGTRPVIIVDGKITVGGSSQLIANSAGTGVEFISFKSSASCSPNCTSLTGNELKTSQALETVNVGGTANMPGMVFDAYWGKITLGGTGNIGSAIGQTIDMSGAGTVTFGTTLSSGSHTWTMSSYQQRYPSQP